MTGWLIRALLLVLIVGSLLRAVWRLLAGVVDGASGTSGAARRGPREVAGVPLVRDPVCGTYVVKTRALTVRRGDDVEYFCSERCRDQFKGRA
jgi:YHS domain-containing protein